MSRGDFTFDKARNVYICPQGKLLHTTGYVHDGTTLLYRARVSDCGPCPLKPRCCPKTPERKIPRSIHEDARDLARALVGTPAFEQSRRNRKRVEMLFAHLKRILRLGRLRLRSRAAHKMSSRSAPSRRTSAALQSWLLDRRQQQSRALRNGSKRPPASSGRTNNQSPPQEAAAGAPRLKSPDFCNKIGTKRTLPPPERCSLRGATLSGRCYEFERLPSLTLAV